MNQEFSNLYILKTNVRSERMLKGLAPALNEHMAIKSWSIDLEDVDKVLRIEGEKHLEQQEILHLISLNGFQGEELKG